MEKRFWKSWFNSLEMMLAAFFGALIGALIDPSKIIIDKGMLLIFLLLFLIIVSFIKYNFFED